MVGVVIAGSSVIGGVVSSKAGSKASKAQQQAAAQAAAAEKASAEAQIAEQRRQYDQTRADYEPYRTVGYAALGKLAGMYGVGSGAGTTGGYANDGGFTVSPGYQFRMDEGIKAIDRSNAARGILNSGGADKARMRYAHGLASSYEDTYANRLSALAGVGQSATGSTAAAGSSATNAISNALANSGNAQANAATAAGNARASSYANTANAINSTTSNLASLYMYSNGGGFK